MTQKKEKRPLTQKIREKLEAMLADCQAPVTKIDLRGHGGYEIGEILDLNVKPTEYAAKWSWEYWKSMTSTHLSSKHHIESALLIEDEIFAQRTFDLMKMGGTAKCSACGERLAFAQKGDTLIATNECAHPGGIKPYTVLIDVPSGEIVFANDLRALTDVEDNYDVNTSLGLKLTTQSYAADGMAHIFVGNTCPPVYKTEEGLTVTLNNNWNDDDDDDDKDNLELGKKQEHICTDLWWYSAMDKDLFEARCVELGVNPTDFMTFSVKVEPGVYSFSDEQADCDAHGIVHLSKILPSQEKAPKLKERPAKNAQTLKESQFWNEIETLKKSPLFKENRNYALADILTVLGNGYEWSQGQLRNRDGQIVDEPFKTEQGPIENPRNTDFVPTLPGFQVGFRAEDMAYPMSFRHNRLLNAPKDVDPYWLAGCMMYLKSAIDADCKMIGQERMTKEQHSAQKETNRQVMIAALERFCHIAVHQKISLNGRLERIFKEISAAWES